jgi:hypothetical protein
MRAIHGLSHGTVNKYRIQFLCQKGTVNVKSTQSKSLANGKGDVVTHCSSTKKSDKADNTYVGFYDFIFFGSWILF